MRTDYYLIVVSASDRSLFNSTADTETDRTSISEKRNSQNVIAELRTACAH